MVIHSHSEKERTPAPMSVVKKIPGSRPTSRKSTKMLTGKEEGCVAKRGMF
jgi:hypothetical protein